MEFYIFWSLVPKPTQTYWCKCKCMQLCSYVTQMQTQAQEKHARVRNRIGFARWWISQVLLAYACVRLWIGDFHALYKCKRKELESFLFLRRRMRLRLRYDRPVPHVCLLTCACVCVAHLNQRKRCKPWM